jgi:hypothetical protein
MKSTTLVLLVSLGTPVAAQQLTIGGLPIAGIPDDWTHHHIVFSNPGTEEEAIKNGTHDRWLAIVNDPRYILQQLHRGQPAQGSAAPARPAPAPTQLPLPATPARGTFAIPAVNARRPVQLARDRNTLAINPAPGNGAPGPDKHRLRKDWSMDLGAGAMGLTTFPAKYTFTTAAASCANDYVAFSTGILGTASQATITGYNRLYTACGGAVPTVAWQYNTAGDSFLSPVLSLDGSQVAYVQYVCTASCGDTGEVDLSSLVVLKWASNPALVTLSSTAPASYRACAAPCMTALTFANSGFSGFSSPFYDYSSDAIYIGDDTGVLHQFTGVFKGVPAENTTSPWPVTLSANSLSQPVLDHVSGKIFVGDTGGFYYALNATTTAITGTSAQLDFVYGLWDAPLVDSSAQMTYVFAGNDGQTNCYDEYSGEYGCSGVFSFPTNFTNLANVESQVYVGYYPLFTGAFDNIYLTSSAASPTGHLYVCGETDYDFVQVLNQIPISANVMGGQSVSPYYLGDGYPCSAVTEFYNTNAAADYIFLSVEGAYQGCTQDTGCVFGFNVTSGAVPTAPTAGSAEAGGTSAIVIDNAGAVTGTSQIYFATLSNTGTCATSGGTGLCAIQTSQAAP